MMKKVFAILFVFLLLGTIGGFLFRNTLLDQYRSYGIENFTQCAEKGFPVAESYPRQCFLPNGKGFTEIVPTDNPEVSPTPSIVPSPFPTHSSIRVTTPKPGSLINSPMTITGQAQGGWFFEGSFPVILKDTQGNEISRTTAVAQEAWTTTDFVAFTATISYGSTNLTSGFIVLEKDNPSGLEENSDSYTIPIFFDKSALLTD